MEDGHRGWKRRPETTAAPPPAKPVIVRSPYRCHQNKRTRVENRLLSSCWLRTLTMASQPSPLGAPVLTSQQANLTPSILPTPPQMSIWLVSCSAITTTRQTVVLVRFCSQGDRPGHSGTDGGDKIKQNNRTAGVRHQDQGSRAASTRLATRARRQQSVWSLSLRWEDTSENHHAFLNFPQAP